MGTVAEINSTADRVRDTGIRELFGLESRWQAWLDVEAALALAQARVGMIPEGAARRIAEVAQLDALDRARIDESTRRTAHTLVPLVWELARVAGDDAGGWVHWGATTQNIVQTGDLLILRRTHRTFGAMIDEILTVLADLAERAADLPVAARTHGQHAVPTTFGFKVATWIDEFLRHSERLRDLEHRVFVVLLGGAAGTHAAMGRLGPAVQRELAALLQMTPMPVPARSIADHLAEYVSVLGLLAGTTGKLGRELFSLMRTEYGEVEEPIPAGTVGSSTMPHKRNPHLLQDIIARSASVRGAVPLALEATMVEHEADRARELIMQEALSTACIAMGDALARLEYVLGGLQLHPERMARNLHLTNGLIMTEAVMMRLGEQVGRQDAHDAVYDASQAIANSGGELSEILAADPRVAPYLDREAIDGMLNPSSYLGHSAEIAREAAARARETRPSAEDLVSS